MTAWLHGAVMALPVVAYLVSGLLATLLQPRNASARRLLLAAVLLGISRLLEYLLIDRASTAAELADSWLLRWIADTTFLCGLAALVATLATFPDGQPASRADTVVVRVVTALAVLSSLAVLVGSPTLGIGRQSYVDNPAYVPGLSPLGTLGRVVAATEPLWALAGVALLFWRRRHATPAMRAELRWPLWTLGVFAVMLVLAIGAGSIAAALGAGDVPGVQPAFLIALSLFPMGLVAGIAARGRRNERDLLESRRRLLHAEDAARRQLERDLHDGAQQQLVGVLSLLQLAQRQQTRNDPQTSETLSRATDETRRAMQDLRAIATGIHPSVLTDRGLVEALDGRLAVLPFEVSVAASGDAASRRWPPAVEAAAYFIACEALTNAAKHANATAVEVRVDSRSGDLRVVVADNGRGFDPARTTQRGLAGAADRAAALGGRLEVRSAAGTGTTVELRLPGTASA